MPNSMHSPLLASLYMDDYETYHIIFLPDSSGQPLESNRKNLCLYFALKWITSWFCGIKYSTTNTTAAH